MNRVIQTNSSTVTINRWVKNRKQQVWWFDPVKKMIFSNYWKNYCLEIPSSGTAKDIKLTSNCKSRWWNLFRYQGDFIVNERGTVFDVHGGIDAENRNVISWTKHGKINQQWDVIYADEYPGEPGKGELNEKFGLYVERDFHIVSALNSHRYIDLVSSQLVIKTPNSLKTQIWYFHQQSLTIRSKNNN
jgi:hypothetical protein